LKEIDIFEEYWSLPPKNLTKRFSQVLMKLMLDLKKSAPQERGDFLQS